MPSKLEARVDKHDKQIAAMQKLLLTGMKMLNGSRVELGEMRVQLRETRALVDDNALQIKALTKETRENARILKELMRSLGRQDQANGHGKPPKGL